MTPHALEVRVVRTLSAVLVTLVGVPLLFLATLLVFAGSILWPSRLIRRWAAMLRETPSR